MVAMSNNNRGFMITTVKSIMKTPQENAEDAMKVEDNTTEHLNSFQESPENPQSLPAEDLADRMALQSRIDEDSNLISMLKRRADELLLRYQALGKINTELEDKVALCHKELDSERRRSATLEERFTALAANNQAIISFMEEHKHQNAQLKEENKQLQSENDSLFSQKLHDGEVLVQKLTGEMKLLREKNVNDEKEHREELAACELKLQEQAAQHKAKEALLLSELHDAHQQHADAVEMCKDLKRKLEEAKDQRALKETSFKESTANLAKENAKLLCESIERGKVIQEKQREIQQLETKWREERKNRIEAQDRFELEAEAVNADLRVKSLQSSLDESKAKLQGFIKDFDAFKEHSANLLAKEKELNKKLSHMKI